MEKELVGDPDLRIGSLNIGSLNIGSLNVVVRVPIWCDDEVVAKLERAARECPVHWSFALNVQQQIVFEWGAD